MQSLSDLSHVATCPLVALLPPTTPLGAPCSEPQPYIWHHPKHCRLTRPAPPRPSPRAGQNSAPEQPISRAQLRDDPPWVCQLDCKEATGVNSTWKRMLDPPYQIANYLQRLPNSTIVWHLSEGAVGGTCPART
jgi:hypothetical protein